MIYHIWLGELRGVFPTVGGMEDKFVRNLGCDPFGLYVGVGVGVRRQGTEEEEGDGFITEVVVFEVVTGREVIGSSPSSEENSVSNPSRLLLPPTSSFSWSPDATRLSVTSSRGTVSTRSLPGFIVANCYELRRKLRADGGWWATFPMYVNVSAERARSSGGSVRGGGGLGASRSGGSILLNSGPNTMGSRMSSKANFSISELSNSQSQDNLYAGVPKMSGGSGSEKEKMYSGENTDSNSTFFGRHSSASSETN